MEAATPEPPPPPPPPPSPPPAPTEGAYPVRFDAGNQGDYNRFLPLIKWLIALPHYIRLVFLGIGAIFVILFTAKLPQGMFNLILNPLRWQARGNAYAGWLVTRYPPFSWDDE